MKRLFWSFLVLTSIIFSKNDDIPDFYINLYDSIPNNQDICTINTSKGNFSFNLSDPNDFKNLSLINSLELSEQLIVAAIITEFICCQTYHMTGKQKEKLLSSDHQDVVRQLLKLDHVSDQHIWKLWEEYKQNHRWGFAYKSKYEQKLKDGLFKRKKEQDKKIAEANRKEKENKKKLELERIEKEKEHKRVQEQQRHGLVKKYNSNILVSNSEYVSSYQRDRQKALEQTIVDGGKKYVKTYEVDAPTQALMQMQGIDYQQFKNLSGTIFSHQIFQECAQHYKKAAKVIFEYGLKNSTLVPHILEFTKAAFIGTQYEQFAVAVQLSDIAEILADISVGASKGIISYACNMIDLVRDPKQIIIAAKHLTCSLIRVTQTLGGALVKYDQEGTLGVTSLQACQQAFGDDMALFNQMSDVSKQNFVEWHQKASTQDKAQAVSGIVADCLITPFVVGKAMKVCGGILYQAKEAVSLARAVELAEELGLGFVEVEELLLATESGIPKLPVSAVEVESALTSLMENEVSIAKNSGWFSDVNSVKTFVENIQNIRLKNGFYKNNLLQKESIKYFEQYVYKQELLEFCKGIEKEYGIIIVEDAGKKIEMLCNPQHIMLPDLDFKTSTRLQRTNGIIGGGHVDISIQALQKNGFIKVVSQEELFGGCKALEIEHLFGDGILKKTIWPSDWTAQQIMEAIKEAWHNQFLYIKRFFKEVLF